MSALREQLIEAGLEVYNRYRNDFEAFDDSLDFIGQALDAILDKLHEQAKTWQRAAVRHRGKLTPDPKDYVAALRGVVE